MAPEVISLLSSPGQPPSPPLSGPASVRSLTVLPAETGSLPNESPRRLDYDYFDLTEDTPQRVVPTTRSHVGGTKRISDDISCVRTNFYLSDDFDTTGDISYEVPTGDAGDRVAKRARLSGDNGPGPESSRRILGRSLSAAENPFRPPVRQHCGVRRWNATLDPIEFTSSPDAAGRSTSNKGKAVNYGNDVSLASSPLAQNKENLPPEGQIKAAKPSLAGFDFSFTSSPPSPRPRSPKPWSPNKSTAWDPISSSAPQPSTMDDNSFDGPSPLRRPARCQSEVINIQDSDDDASSASSDDFFPELADIDISKLIRDKAALAVTAGRHPAKMVKKGATMKAGVSSSSSSRSRPTTTGSAKPRARTTTGGANSATDPADKTRDPAEKAAAREAEKERKKLEREAAREQKALERERAVALAEVNKIRTDKKQSTPEMLVDLPARLNPTIRLQVETLLGGLDAEHATWHSPVDTVVRWRRKVRCRYDAELGHWEPTPLRIAPEKHALVVMPAAEFVELALGRGSGSGCESGNGSGTGSGSNGSDNGNGIDEHVGRMQTHFPDHTLIYLIEGLTVWMRKNRTVRNRQFTAAVRELAGDGSAPESTSSGAGGGAGDPPPSSQPAGSSASTNRRRKKRALAAQYVDEDVVEDALLNLQVVHGAFIHHTGVPIETAQWIAVFTQHISTIPYRRVREQANDAAATFCMDSGQVRTGDSVPDTYVRMLQEIARVTAPIAYGVAAEFPTVSALVRGLEEGGPLRLEACRKSANKDGAFSDRAVGQAVSRRIYKVFTGRDEGSTDV